MRSPSEIAAAVCVKKSLIRTAEILKQKMGLNAY